MRQAIFKLPNVRFHAKSRRAGQSPDVGNGFNWWKVRLPSRRRIRGIRSCREAFTTPCAAELLPRGFFVRVRFMLHAVEIHSRALECRTLRKRPVISVRRVRIAVRTELENFSRGTGFQPVRAMRIQREPSIRTVFRGSTSPARVTNPCHGKSTQAHCGPFSPARKKRSAVRTLQECIITSARRRAIVRR